MSRYDKDFPPFLFSPRYDRDFNTAYQDVPEDVRASMERSRNMKGLLEMGVFKEDRKTIKELMEPGNFDAGKLKEMVRVCDVARKRFFKKRLLFCQYYRLNNNCHHYSFFCPFPGPRNRPRLWHPR